MANQGINYTSRNFADIRAGLIDMVKQYYPDIFNDYNDASVGMMILELNAAVGDMLSFNTDRMFQETQIDYAQERSSVLSMARTFGLKIPGKRPSITIVDFSVTVPVFGDTFDISYAPIIAAGSQVTGAGKVFETTDDINFASPFTTGGIPNRLILPNFDANDNLINYTLVKREIVINGFTKIFKKVITSSDVRPFIEIVLPDNNVLSIDSVITLDGTNFVKNPAPEQFIDLNKRWFEMDALAEDKIFIEDNTRVTDNAGVKPGKWMSVTRKFITEYTDLGFIKLILGGGTQDTSSLCDFDTNKALVNQIGDFINNLSLGVTPTANTTMFIKYRVGGGSDSNIGTNVLKGLGVINITVNGNNATTNNAVKASLKVNNLFPALGGRNVPSIDEIRNMVRYNFSSQNRAVTIKDYQSRISLMPGKFGVPFRSGIFEEQNKIKVYILGLDANSKLSNTSTSALKENISQYLADYRMLNDYVQITNGRIINLGFQVDVQIDKKVPQSQIITQVISEIVSYMDINKFEMGDSIYLSNLIETINNVVGVINVIELRAYNKVGEGKYSLNEISQPYVDFDTKQIDTSADYTLFGEPTSMFEIKYPTSDIEVRVR
jgi:hypothetical protein